MLFGRKRPPSWAERVRTAVWPRRSWGRSFRYIGKRMLRISATPHAIAAGVAAGVFASFTPFIGLHILLGCGIAILMRGNVLAAALGTAVGNPLTFPLIWASTYGVGTFLLGGLAPTVSIHTVTVHDLLTQSIDVLVPLILPMIVGGIPVGLVAGAVSYVVMWYLVRGYQLRRLSHLKAKAAAATRAVAAARALERG